jgi:hypothetical protein
MREQVQRRWRRRGAAVVVLGLVGAGVLGAATADAQTAPTVTVTPDNGLADGTDITVAGAGLTPGMTVFVGIVNPDPSLGEGLARVVLLPEGEPEAVSGFVVGPDGTLTVELEVAAGQIGTNPESTCPPSAAQQARGFTYCRIFISSAVDSTDTAQVDVAFGAQEPPPGSPDAPTTTTTTAPPTTTTTAPPPESLATTGDATPALAVVACALLGFGIIAVHLHDDHHTPRHRRR